MKRVQNVLLALLAAVTFTFGSVACDNTARGAREDANQAADKAGDAADKAADKADKATDAAKAEAKDEKSDAAKATNEATARLDAATETIDVKSALMADASVDASDINVDTLHETKTVVLKGTVATAAQKTEAGKIAAREAEGYKIDNQLTVKARP